MRNAICFRDSKLQSNRNLIIAICAIVQYWSGNMKGKVSQHLGKWLPTGLDMIPLQCLSPLTPQLIEDFDCGMVPVVPMLTDD